MSTENVVELPNEEDKTDASKANVAIKHVPSSPYPTVKLFSQRHPSFSEQSVRYHIHNREKNGLDKFNALIRIGKKVLIDEERWFEWVRSKRTNKSWVRPKRTKNS